MLMIKIVRIVFLTILTSFYFFPFEFVFLPGVNTKMALAGLGIVLLIVQLAMCQKSFIDKTFFQLSLWAAATSLLGFLSVVLNGTYDYTYVTYIVSMWVWLSGAYVVINSIKKLYGMISVELVCNYLVLVCLMQCVIAFTMTQFPPLKDFVDGFLGSTGFMGKVENRMYGIGASLDVAGSRFSVILVMIINLMIRSAIKKDKYAIGFYVCAFIIISVIGNMISRTTTVGIVVALVYFVYVSKIYTFHIIPEMIPVYQWFLGGLLVGILVIVWGYHTNPAFNQSLRFGFEGFFSLVEQGKWEVHSNEILNNMYIFPDNLKTWIIGDGYFNDPSFTNEPYYVGPKWGGYYQGTDVGYLRFIFYFGLLGLVTFSIFMFKVGKACMVRFSSYREMFAIILLLNFIVWFKVSSDIFLVFALFLCIGEIENQESEQGLLNNLDE